MAQASVVLKQKIINVQQYSHNTDMVTFYFERYTNSGIDLSTLEAWILIDTVDSKKLVEYNSNTQVTLEWVIDGSLTQKEQELPFQIVFTNNDNIKLYTTVGKLKVNKSLGAM